MKVMTWRVEVGDEPCLVVVLERLRVTVVIRVGTVTLCVLVDHGGVVIVGLRVVVMMTGGVAVVLIEIVVILVVMPPGLVLVVGGSRRVVDIIVGRTLVVVHIRLDVRVARMVDVSLVCSLVGVAGQWQNASRVSVVT